MHGTILAMKLFIGITDPGWFQYLKDHQADEMNFWRPRYTGKISVCWSQVSFPL